MRLLIFLARSFSLPLYSLLFKASVCVCVKWEKLYLQVNGIGNNMHAHIFTESFFVNAINKATRRDENTQLCCYCCCCCYCKGEKNKKKHTHPEKCKLDNKFSTSVLYTSIQNMASVCRVKAKDLYDENRSRNFDMNFAIIFILYFHAQTRCFVVVSPFYLCVSFAIRLIFVSKDP